MGKRLLLIEDEEPVREVILEYLNLAFPEVKVKTAATLEEARRLCAEAPYDLIISDCTLPDGSACDLLRNLHSGTPVIIITGQVDEELLGEVETTYRGPLHLLRKPVSLEQIRSLVERYLGRAS